MAGAAAPTWRSICVVTGLSSIPPAPTRARCSCDPRMSTHSSSARSASQRGPSLSSPGSPNRPRPAESAQLRRSLLSDPVDLGRARRAEINGHCGAARRGRLGSNGACGGRGRGRRTGRTAGAAREPRQPGRCPPLQTGRRGLIVGDNWDLLCQRAGHVASTSVGPVIGVDGVRRVNPLQSGQEFRIRLFCCSNSASPRSRDSHERWQAGLERSTRRNPWWTTVWTRWSSSVRPVTWPSWRRSRRWSGWWSAACSTSRSSGWPRAAGDSTSSGTTPRRHCD